MQRLTVNSINNKLLTKILKDKSLLEVGANVVNPMIR